jgi:putative ABC transport system permease protein
MAISNAPERRIPTAGHVPLDVRWRAMARVALRMCLHDRSRAIGTTFGVVFALVLTIQNLATLAFLIRRNTMYVENAGAQLWVVPAGTQRLEGGAMLPSGVLMQARVCRGVQWAEPLIWGNAAIKLPSGGSQPVVLIGTRLPSLRGGPWNMVAASPQSLRTPDAVIFEDSEREKLGGLNLGDFREVNGHRIQVTGFTWGLLPFSPSLAFSEYDTARALLEIPADRLNYVIVGLEPNANVEAVQAELASAIPEASVVTTEQLRDSTTRFVLFDQGVGMMIVSATVIDLLVGFAIVALALFTSVLENLREFATMKAMGTTNMDLAKLLLVQAMIYATSGTCGGIAVVCAIVWSSRSARYNLTLNPTTVAESVIGVVVLCIGASMLALLRLRRVEPAMVFR